MSSSNKNFFVSTLGSFAFQIVRSCQQLVWVPLFLSAFGKEVYGEWIILFSIAGYASMSDIGIQVYWLNLLTNSHIKGDFSNYRKLFRGGIFLFLIVAATIIIIFTLLTYFIGPKKFLDLHFLSDLDSALIFTILLFSSLISLLSRMIRGIFRTVGENPKVVFFEVFRQSLLLFVVSIFLLLNFSPLYLSFVYLSVSMLFIFIIFYSIRSRFSYLLDFALSFSDYRPALLLFRGGSIHFLGVFSILLYSQGTLFLTNILLGASSVAFIATCRSLVNLVRQFTSSITLSALPEFSILKSNEKYNDLYSLLFRSFCLVFFISGLSCFCLITLGPYFYNLWTSNSFPDSSSLIFLFSFSLIFDSIRLPFHDFLLGCNHIYIVALSNIFHSFTSLILFYFTFQSFGIFAVPVSSIISNIILGIPILFYGVFKVVDRRVFFKLFRLILNNLIIFTITTLPIFYIIFFTSFGLIPLFAISLFSIALFVLFTWFCSFNCEDRNLILSSFSTILSKYR